MALLALVLANAAVYAPALDAPFLFDDRLNIEENPYIRVGSLGPDQLYRAAAQDRFQLRPLSNLTFALDFWVHGLDRRLMRAENIFIHCLVAWLVFLIVRRLIERAAPETGPAAAWTAALIAALWWSMNAAHVQAVTYLVQRQTLLAVLFSLLAFWLYLAGRERTGPARGALVALSFFSMAGAAASKEIGLIAPVILFAYELFPAGVKNGEPRSRRALVLFAAAGAACFFALLYFAVSTGMMSGYLESYRQLGYGPVERVLTEARVTVRYLAVMFLPVDGLLALDHEVEISRGLFSPPATLVAVAFWAAFVAAAGFAASRGHRVVGFAALCGLASLLPESGIIPVEPAYDHRVYLTSLFVIPPLVAAVALAAGTRRAALPIGVSLVLLGALAVDRNLTWRSEEAVWRDSVLDSPGSARAWSNLCAALMERDLRRALDACAVAVRLDPDEDEPKVNRAVALALAGKRDEAGRAFHEAAGSHPGSALARFNYGAYLESGGLVEEAMAEYRGALAADQFHFDARLRLGRLLLASGRPGEARIELDLLTRLYPDRQDGWLFLAAAAAESGDRGAARQALARARAAGPPTPLLLDLEAALDRPRPD